MQLTIEQFKNEDRWRIRPNNVEFWYMMAKNRLFGVFKIDNYWYYIVDGTTSCIKYGSRQQAIHDLYHVYKKLNTKKRK